MTKQIKDIRADAAQLSHVERAELIDRLIEGLSPADRDIEAAWVEEVARRIDALDGGEMESKSIADVLLKFKRS